MSELGYSLLFEPTLVVFSSGLAVSGVGIHEMLKMLEVEESTYAGKDGHHLKVRSFPSISNSHCFLIVYFTMLQEMNP